jgi:hypothetical protein
LLAGDEQQQQQQHMVTPVGSGPADGVQQGFLGRQLLLESQEIERQLHPGDGGVDVGVQGGKEDS